MGELLKPCPFCQSPGELHDGMASCSNILCCGDDVWTTEEIWNRRAPDPRIAKLEKLLREAADTGAQIHNAWRAYSPESTFIRDEITSLYKSMIKWTLIAARIKQEFS